MLNMFRGFEPNIAYNKVLEYINFEGHSLNMGNFKKEKRKEFF